MTIEKRDWGRVWARSTCPICGLTYEHPTDYQPKTCGKFICLQEANKRGLLRK